MFNCYFFFFKPFYLVAATTGGLLVSVFANFEIGTLALHPGPFKLTTVTSNVLMTYYVDNFYGLHDR